MIKEKTIYEYVQNRLESVLSKTENMKKRFNEYALIAIDVENPNAWKNHKANLQSWEEYAGRLQALKDLEGKETAFAIHDYICHKLYKSTGRFVTEFQKGFLDELSRASYILSNLNIFESP